MFYWLCLFLIWLPFRLFFPTKIIGKENLPKGKCVVVCNHYSNLDVLVINCHLNKKFYFLAKKELFKNKLMALIFKSFGAYPIDRQTTDIKAYKFALSSLNSNKPLFIFPEGTRNKAVDETQMNAIKSGAVVFASKGDAQIVPMLLYRKPRFLCRNVLYIGKPFSVVGENPQKLTKEELKHNMSIMSDRLSSIRGILESSITKKKIDD